MLLFSLIYTGCSQTITFGEQMNKGNISSDVVDKTIDIVDPPVDGHQFITPDIELEPYSEVNLCYYGTYRGPSVGVNFMTPFSPNAYTHHAWIMGVYDDDYEDGEIVDCINQGEDNMPIYAPLFEAVGFDVPGGEPFEIDPLGGLNWIHLPEGVAFKLEDGQRWTLDVHYINTTGERVLVNTGFNVGTVPEQDVVHWASPLTFDGGTVNLQPGENEMSFQCPWDDDYNILSIMGHMHYFGEFFRVNWDQSNGDSELIYNIDNWDPTFRDYPELKSYKDGEVTVRAGDLFTTSCKWHNVTDEVLAYPDEMCSTVIVAYPLDKPKTCIKGEYTGY